MFSFNSFSICVLIFFPSLSLSQGPDEAMIEKKMFTAVCSGEPPGLVKFFKKAYECSLNVSSAQESKFTADCFKEVTGVDEPSTYEGHQELLCKGFKEGKDFSTKDCEIKKMGEDVYKARDAKMEKCMSAPFSTNNGLMMILGYCVDLVPEMTAVVDKQFQCQQKLNTPAMRANEVDCWRRYNETWPADLSGQKKIICNDVDKMMIVTMCIAVGKQEPSLKPEADKTDAEFDGCMKK